MVEEKFETVSSSKSVSKKDEGGLRTRGFLKTTHKEKPLISIITVVYNGERYLEETIQSVINQSYANVEYIIIDGGSRDKTLEIIKKYEDKIDYWVSEKDSGIYDAMNKGIELAHGEIIGIVNADDFIYHSTLEKTADFFIKDPALMFTYGDLDLIDEERKNSGAVSSLGLDDLKYKVFKQMPFLHPTMFVRLEAYKKLGVYDLEYKLSADYDFILRLIENKMRSKRVDFKSGVFRLGGQSGGKKSYFENHKLLLKHGVNPVLVFLNTTILFAKLFLRKVFS
jgi:glycosyltransferase involved in cell wall biosynthesis